MHHNVSNCLDFSALFKNAPPAGDTVSISLGSINITDVKITEVWYATPSKQTLVFLENGYVLQKDNNGKSAIYPDNRLPETLHECP